MALGDREKGGQCEAEKLREILGALGCSASVTEKGHHKSITLVKGWSHVKRAGSRRAGSPTASLIMLGCTYEAASSGNRYDDPVVEAQNGSTKPRARQRGEEGSVRPVEGEESIASAPCE